MSTGIKFFVKLNILWVSVRVVNLMVLHRLALFWNARSFQQLKGWQKLDIAQGDDVLYIQRKRMADNIPIMLENNYFSYERYSFLMEEELTDSLYEVLKVQGTLAINPGETALEIVTADDQIAKIMEVAVGTPFFFMDTLINDQNNIPIHVGNQYYLGEVYRFYL